jgi:transcriptional regulator with XRE-family HTH domain
MVGKKLRALREDRDMTRVQLAARAGVAPETIEQIETLPHREPSLETLRRLARALGVQPTALI